MTKKQTQSDERYMVIDGRRWRKSDPMIPPRFATELVGELMDARRDVGAANRDNDSVLERAARDRVHDAKIALGERGHAWWLDVDDEALRKRLASSIRTLLRRRGPDKSICPSDAARICSGPNWRTIMHVTREVAAELAEAGWLEITQNGEPVTLPIGGPIRLRML